MLYYLGNIKRSCGGIGIRARLRIESGLTGYGFKSRQLHRSGFHMEAAFSRQ